MELGPPSPGQPSSAPGAPQESMAALALASEAGKRLALGFEPSVSPPWPGGERLQLRTASLQNARAGRQAIRPR